MRAYVQRCDGPKVRVLITLGAQHAGVSDIPRCSGESGGWCSLMRSIVQRGAYTQWAQSNIIQAQYYKNPKQMTAYLESNKFLADVNNERVEKRSSYADRLGELEKFVMVMFTEDQMVVPKQSAWFGFFSEEGEIVAVREQLLYKEDWIGLKRLDERGALVMLECQGDHLRFTDEYFVDLINTYLGNRNVSHSFLKQKLLLQ
jgi:palmitoyl-protein thioesterase